MEASFARESHDHRHSFRFMHLDDVVNWIFQQRLFNAFRRACADFGLVSE